jgi:hydrogenase maturation protease
MSQASAILVIGVGNPFRRDDGVGPALAERVAALALPNVDTISASGEGAALMEAWRGRPAVIVVDAARSGAVSGTITRLDAHETAMPSAFLHYSSHAFGVAEAVELARALGQLPPKLLVYAVEGRDFAAGVGFSAEITAAIPTLLHHITREIARWHNTVTPKARAYDIRQTD